MAHEAYNNEYGQLELVPGTLRGYRCWRTNLSVPSTLFSTNWDLAWPPYNQPEATCLLASTKDECPCMSCKNTRLRHVPPGFLCSCGYYASYDPTTYFQHAGARYIAVVNGAISAHGRIILGTGGFRAQRVKIDALWGENSSRYAHWYNVPWFATRDEMVEAFPPSDVTELLGIRTP